MFKNFKVKLLAIKGKEETQLVFFKMIMLFFPPFFL